MMSDEQDNDEMTIGELIRNVIIGGVAGRFGLRGSHKIDKLIKKMRPKHKISTHEDGEQALLRDLGKVGTGLGAVGAGVGTNFYYQLKDLKKRRKK